MAKLRQVTGSGTGLAMWVGQTITAVIMLFVLIYLIILFAYQTPNNFFALRSLMGANYFRVPATFGAIILTYHAWLGAKSIIMDYLKWSWFRLIKYFGTIIYLTLTLIWFLGTIWSI